jgi:hypothetical protein
MINVTGRDGYIIMRALIFAIAIIDRLPQDEREVGDRDDMMRLLNHVLQDDDSWRISEQDRIARKLDGGFLA